MLEGFKAALKIRCLKKWYILFQQLSEGFADCSIALDEFTVIS
jgi:hypothetical protein